MDSASLMRSGPGEAEPPEEFRSASSSGIARTLAALSGDNYFTPRLPTKAAPLTTSTSQPSDLACPSARVRSCGEGLAAQGASHHFDRTRDRWVRSTATCVFLVSGATARLAGQGTWLVAVSGVVAGLPHLGLSR